MKIKCLHGFYIFEETSIGQVSDFMRRTGLSIVPWKNKFTFEFISEMPEFSLKNKSILNKVASANFEGSPWEIFEANGLIYNFNTGMLQEISTVNQNINISVAGNRLLTNGLILPGSITDDGERVKDYSAWFSRSTLRFQYSEVSYV